MLASACYLICVLSALCVQVQSECTNDNKVWVCSSVHDIVRAGYKPEWTALKLNFAGSEPSAVVPENAFLNTPNLETLSLLGITGLKYNAFKGLTKLKDLHMDWNDVREVKAGMLTGLPITNLFMYFCQIKMLRPRSFDNIPNLKSVFIFRNSIARIPAGVFSYTHIEVLFLNDNGIMSIEEEAFFGMEKLKKLALEANFITSFDPRVYIGNTSPNLRLLWLARNNLTKIQTNSFVDLPNIRVLLYHINHIRTVEEDSFRNLQQLRYMDISNNELAELKPSAFPKEGLQRLEIIMTQNNRLTFLSEQTLSKMPSLNKITIGGNPWKCPCYNALRQYLESKAINIICDDKYFAGSRPVCISPLGETAFCEQTLADSEIYYDLFQKAKKDYEALPPLCKIYCDGKSCYSNDFDVLDY